MLWYLFRANVELWYGLDKLASHFWQRFCPEDKASYWFDHITGASTGLSYWAQNVMIKRYGSIYWHGRNK